MQRARAGEARERDQMKDGKEEHLVMRLGRKWEEREASKGEGKGLHVGAEGEVQEEGRGQGRGSCTCPARAVQCRLPASILPVDDRASLLVAEAGEPGEDLDDGWRVARPAEGKGSAHGSALLSRGNSKTMRQNIIK